MTCQVCRTRDNDDGRGPVKVYGDYVSEGLCWTCWLWAVSFLAHLLGFKDSE